MFGGAPEPIERAQQTVAGDFIRILSDIHYGDRASRVRALASLRPLCAGVTQLVLNGDTLDTRPGPHPAHTAECRAAVLDFFPREVPAVTLLGGNHDPDIAPRQYLDFAGGAVFVTHGDIFFDDIVPWSVDAGLIRRRLAAELDPLPPALQHDLDRRLAIFRRVALSIPQRHQSEKNRVKYLLSFLTDTVWPPLRALRIVRAWRQAPQLAAGFTRRHRPRAKFVVSGHTHRPGIWREAGGVTVINTGSYCPPLGGACVDLAAGQLTVRAIEARGGEFHAGGEIAAFPLAER